MNYLFNTSKKGQASLELLFVVIVVLSLVILVFSNLPKDTNEIMILGIAKNNLDSFVLQTEYSGKYVLDANIADKNLNLNIAFTNTNYNKNALNNTIELMQNELKNKGNFENIYISHN